MLELQRMECAGERLADCDGIKIDLALNLIERVRQQAEGVGPMRAHDS